MRSNYIVWAIPIVVGVLVVIYKILNYIMKKSGIPWFSNEIHRWE